MQYSPTMNSTCVDCESTPAKLLLMAKFKVVIFPAAGLPNYNNMITHDICGDEDIASTCDPKNDPRIAPPIQWRVVREINVHVLNFNLEIIPHSGGRLLD